MLGHRADHAAFVNSSEPETDRDNIIINQKLQVRSILSLWMLFAFDVLPGEPLVQLVLRKV